ncbi:MAG: TolC family protein [Pirellulaceae bacterium]|nr:TolC family protein [Pirellulaceae bacterium]
MQVLYRGRCWQGAFVALLLTLQACAGKPFGRAVPQPAPPAMSVTLPTTYLQSAPNFPVDAAQGEFPGLGVTKTAQYDPGQVVQASHAASGPRSFRDITLNEAIELAMQHSTVIRDLGGRVVTQPGQTTSNLNPVLIGSDPRIGIEAALSAFDAQLSAGFNGRRNNRGLQQLIPLSDSTQIVQNQSDFQAAARRTLTTGTVVGLSNSANYRRDDLGVPPNRFSSAYLVALGGDLRHPLALGSGRDFNLIAGPNAQPGVYNGIFIARVRYDIAEHDFQIAVRDYIGNVVRSYWLLCFAYERMDAADDSLAIAQTLWEAAKTKLAEGTIDSQAEALARDRYLAQQIARDNAAVGSPERTLSGILGTSGALLTGSEPGVESMERRLRFLIGLPAYDGTILRPADRASHVPLTFDPNEALGLALQRRPELLRQNLVVHQKQMELVASRSFARPRVDLVSEVRILGFGDHFGGAGRDEDQNAVHELLSGQLQEWAMGVEMQRPVGLRLGRTTERNALLALNKEAEILRQQQMQIAHEIQAAIAEVDRAQKILDLTEHRRQIALANSSWTIRKFEEGIPIPIEQVLEAQRAVTDAVTASSIAAVDRSIAINNLLIARGTYLQDLGLMLVDSPQTQVGPTTRTLGGPAHWYGLTPQTQPQVDLAAPEQVPPAPTLPEATLLEPTLLDQTTPEVLLLPPEP